MTYDETKARVEELTKRLNHLNYRYYVDHVSEVSDQEFDRMMRELQGLEKQYPQLAKDDSPTKRVGSDLQQEFKHVTHSVPMLSLANSYSVDELLTWYESVKAVYHKEVPISFEPKYDGLSISLIYRHGKFAQAITRGDGVQGDDVTENVKCIERVPLVINEPNIMAMPRFEIRGEVLMPFDSFAKLNREREANGEELFANPRNAAAGTLKSTRSSVVRERMLDVWLYEIVDWPWDNHDQSWGMDYLFGFGVPTAQSFHVNMNSKEKAQPFVKAMADYIINDFTSRRPLMDYPIDGIVFKVSDRYNRQLCGATSKAPKWAIAYKFEAERRITTVRDVTFQVGRTGAVTPVVHFDPIPLAGTLVRKATGNNADFLHEMHIAKGGSIEVEKGGDIIPKIVVGVDPFATKNFCEVTYPSVCPECGAPLVKDGSIYYCIGESCPAQQQAKLEHFVSREAMNIQGIGPKMIEEMLENDLVHDVSDILKFRLPLFLGVINAKTQAAIETSIATTPAHRVLYAIGIRYVGESTSKLLLKHYGDIGMIAAIATACPATFMEVEGEGENTATSLGQWFSDKNNLELLARLQKAGLNFVAEKESVAPDANKKPLDGLTIVISGVFEQHSRDEYRAMIEQYGGKNGSGVSKNTDYILAGSNMGPAKREKAQELDIKIINERQFLNMINE